MSSEAVAPQAGAEALDDTEQDNPFLQAGAGWDDGKVIDFPVERVSVPTTKTEPYDIDADTTGEQNDALILGPKPAGYDNFLNTTALPYR
jgi:hypothetical protein